jgi:hypothetical protein
VNIEHQGPDEVLMRVFDLSPHLPSPEARFGEQEDRAQALARLSNDDVFYIIVFV